MTAGQLQDHETPMVVGLREPCIALEESQIKFIVEDEGTGFDYNNLPDPTLPENISKPGGRGIFLMKNLCDEVSFKKDGRVAELSFYLS